MKKTPFLQVQYPAAFWRGKVVQR